MRASVGGLSGGRRIAGGMQTGVSFGQSEKERSPAWGGGPYWADRRRTATHPPVHHGFATSVHRLTPARLPRYTPARHVTRPHEHDTRLLPTPHARSTRYTPA